MKIEFVDIVGASALIAIGLLIFFFCPRGDMSRSLSPSKSYDEGWRARVRMEEKGLERGICIACGQTADKTKEVK